MRNTCPLCDRRHDVYNTGKLVKQYPDFIGNTMIMRDEWLHAYGCRFCETILAYGERDDMRDLQLKNSIRIGKVAGWIR